MSEILLVNPSKGKGKHKRRASAAQLRALKKGRAVLAASRHLGVRNMAKNPKRRRRAAKTMQSVKHRGRKASRSAFHAAGFSRNPAKRRHKYRRNPAMRPMAFMKETLMPSLMGAGGALGLDFALGYMLSPEMKIKIGKMKPLIRVAGAVGIGFLASMAMGKKNGAAVGAGALTVVLYDEIKKKLTENNPVLATRLSEYPSLEYVSPAIQAGDSMSAYVDGIGMYDDQYS